MPNYPTLTTSDWLLRFGALVLAALTPWILVMTCGWQPSISSYWRTAGQPLFILSNAVTAFYFFSLTGWRLPAILLTLLTAISIDYSQIAHDLIAVAFFLSCIAPLWTNAHHPRLRLVYPFMLSVLGLAHSFMLAEILAISTLVLHQGIELFRAWRILSSRAKSQNNPE